VYVDLCQRHSWPHVVVIVVLVWRRHGTYPHIDERYSLTLKRYIIGAGGYVMPYAVGQESGGAMRRLRISIIDGPRQISPHFGGKIFPSASHRIMMANVCLNEIGP
jgi:hypothetical protein